MTIKRNELLSRVENSPVYWMFPEDIEYGTPFLKYLEIKPRYVWDLDSDWDNLGRLFKNSVVYKTFKSRCEGIPWEETIAYKKRLASGYLTPEWISKTVGWDEMINDIVNNGYTHRPLSDKIDEYILILIGRHGHPIIYNGIHRLSCCLLSKHRKKIPVKVLARHPRWERFKTLVTNYAENHTGQLYSCIPHFDLDHINANWPCERSELIAESAINKKGRVFDAGSHWGVVSYHLAQKGFKCVAMEKNTDTYNVMRKIQKLPGKSFKTIKKDVLSVESNTISTDILLLLNLVHHFQMKKDTFNKFIAFLDKLDTKEIFYHAHKNGDKWSTSSAMNLKPKEVLEIISKTSGLTKIDNLATLKGRSLYHLHA